MKIARFFLPVFAAALLAGCSKSGGDSKSGYSITLTYNDKGSAKATVYGADAVKAEPGTSVLLTATPIPGCEFVKWTVTEGTITFSPDAMTNPVAFTMPAANVSVTAEFIVPTPVLSVSPEDAIHFTANAPESENMVVAVMTNQLSWDATSDQTWCKVTKSDNAFTVSAVPNTSASAPTPAKITITAGNASSLSINVTQEAAIKVTSITLSKGTIALAGGENVQLTATVLPDDATDNGVTWSSSAPAVASVDQTGNVTASASAANGSTATITATASDGSGTTASCDVAVRIITSEDVTINGVVWAGSNVAESGKFAAKPTDYGCLYQWNRKKAWPADNTPPISWPASGESGESWDEDNDPCPDGYRVPTDEELAKLIDADAVTREWTTLNDIYGRKLTDKVTNASMFLPASGARGSGSGVFQSQGGAGYYWSATTASSSETDANYTVFNYSYIIMNSGARTLGASVRCVRK